MGKGSKRRPAAVAPDTFASNYDRIFGKKVYDCDHREGTLITVEGVPRYQCSSCQKVLEQPIDTSGWKGVELRGVTIDDAFQNVCAHPNRERVPDRDGFRCLECGEVVDNLDNTFRALSFPTNLNLND